MKKIILALSIVSISFISCLSAGDTENYDIVIRKNKTDYKIKKVFIDNRQTYIYIIYPINDSLNIFPLQNTFKSGKVTETIVELK